MFGHPIGAVLFDLDGTLVRTRIDFARMRRAVLHEVAALGLDPEPFRAMDLLRIPDAAVAAGRLEAGEERSFRRRVEAALIAIELAGCDGAQEAEGAGELLRWLQERAIRVGIVTRNSREAVTRLLAALPLPHDLLLTRADTPRVKPDPIHLRLALDRLGVPPARAVMVGDHVMDVLGGKAAGTRTLGLLTPERPRDFFDAVAPDGVLASLGELRAWISPSSS